MDRRLSSVVFVLAGMSVLTALSSLPCAAWTVKAKPNGDGGANNWAPQTADNWTFVDDTNGPTADEDYVGTAQAVNRYDEYTTTGAGASNAHLVALIRVNPRGFPYTVHFQASYSLDGSNYTKVIDVWEGTTYGDFVEISGGGTQNMSGVDKLQIVGACPDGGHLHCGEIYCAVD